MDPSLLILAAGVGSRYGGLKQLDPVGPNGETVLEYAVFDARRAGFAEVVLVIRPETEAAFVAALASRLPASVRVRYVHQRLDDLPADCVPPGARSRPWGTGHAVLAARQLLNCPFAVINADDFYGAEAFASLAAFCREQPDATGSGAIPTFAMIGYRLGDTLAATGPVSRALCRCDDTGFLTAIEEIPAIAARAGHGVYRDETGRERTVPDRQLVSMNIWGFTPEVFPLLEAAFVAFLQRAKATDDQEFYLPLFVQTACDRGDLRVRVLPGAGRWFGITHRQDRRRVVDALADLATRGEYPQPLWS